MKTEPVLSAPPPAPKRPLLAAKDAGAGGGVRFRMLTYNILAEIYATQQMYPYCDFWALNWNYRVVNLIRELKDAAADIMCLQEVQADHYEKHLKPQLSDAGFDSLFKQKTREDMGGKGKIDGCATFWRRTKFRLAEHYGIEFNEPARNQAQAEAESDDQEREMLNRLLKDNVAQILVLEVLNRVPRQHRTHASSICVVNTHLYSAANCPDVKLWQCNHLVAELEQLAVGHISGRDLPLMICGDFNSLPGSGVHNLLSERAISDEHPDFAEDQAHILPHAQDMTHSLDLESVYGSMNGGVEPPFTNYTTGFRGTLDYMWYTPNHIRPLAIAAIPDEEELLQNGPGMPNPQYSSDHFMLCADMQLGGNLVGGGVGVPGVGASTLSADPPPFQSSSSPPNAFATPFVSPSKPQRR